ncbi:hypothetical protein [Nonomuraea turcica]|uniref:hypothetical protein n=1 Tax=Nonomuraea sp. G32 TaxID=3067274 RepID=UPI00273B6115|nr:hypothetical protein [Nonomuraea sp. G32]MDP4511543.1 hypothetical protein [Nonomuraea sp. G32]
MRARKSLVAVTAVLALGAGAYFSAVSAHSPPAADEVTIAHGEARLPSDLPVNWVSYADHLAEVKVVSEQEVPPSAEELQAGEGYIGRTGTLEIQRVLWSREGAAQPPASLTMHLAGWEFTGDVRRRLAGHDTPRVEIGHTYLMAMTRYSEGWGPLGPGGTLPYDNGVIGQGESEGTPQTIEDARTTATEDDATVRAKVVGQPAEALVALLRATAPDPKVTGLGGLPADKRWEQVAGPVE